MKSTIFKILAIAIPFLWASQAASKSFHLSGTIETVAPKVSIPEQVDQQAFVKPYRLVATQAEDSGCRLTGEPGEAKADNGKELVCLFEWTKLPEGITGAGMTTDGYFDKEGANTFGYTISYFSGTELEKVELLSDEFTVKTVAPIAPDFRSVKTTLSDGVFDGLDVTNYNKAAGLSKVTVSADKRDYRQVATIKNIGSCVIEIGDTECDIKANLKSLGVEGQATGETTYELSIDSENSYFKTKGENYSKDYTVKWDYRTPTATGLYLQARTEESGTTESHEIDGVSFVVENEQAKVIVETPHFGLAGSWWVPTAKVELKPNPDFHPENPVFEVDGRNVVKPVMMMTQPQENFVLSPVGTPIVSNGKYIYTYDLHSVADGSFIPVVTVSDKYNNKNEKEFDPVALDRNAPDIELVYKDNEFVNEGDVYFFEDMTVIALDTFDGGAEIVSAKVNGETIELEGESKYAKSLKAASLNLTPAVEYPLEITVRDSAGNTFTKGFRVNYMPMKYEIKNDDQAYYRKVQRVELEVDQTKGKSCGLYSSESEMKERDFQYGEEIRCVLEWTNLPPGTSGSYERGVHSLTGSFQNTSDEMMNEVGFRVWMYDKNGVRALAAENSSIIQVDEAPDPTLTIRQQKVIDENFFPVELDGSRFTTAQSEGVNADLELTADDGDEVETKMAQQRRGNVTKASVYQTLSVPAGELWDQKNFQVESKYRLDTSKATKTEVKTVYVPSKRIRARVASDSEDRKTLDTLTPTVTMTLGVYDNKSRALKYDKETMGTWKVYLAQEHRDPDTREMIYDKLTDVKEYSGQSVNFDLDVSDVGYGSYRYVGVADLESPIEEYQRKVVSNSSFYRVLKGGAIDGKLKTYKIASPVPFRVNVSFDPENREDRQALGDITWEMSVNGTDNWKVIEDSQGSKRLRQKLEEPAHYFVRATIENQYSGVKRTSEVLELLGYNVPDLKLKAPAALYQGEKGEVTLYDHDEPANEQEGQIEWSTDGDNWEEGGHILPVVGTGKRMKFWVRMSYFNNELAEEKRYDKARKQISVKKPKPVRISVDTPRVLEVGETYKLDAIVRLATSQLKSEVISEWVLPNGTTKPGLSLNYVPTIEDGEKGHTDLEFHAWVKGLKDSTYAKRDINVRAWKYKLPEYRFDVNYRTRYAPVSATAIMRKLESQPVPVEYTYNFVPFDGMVKDRQSSGRLYFTATKPGIHELTVIIKDDRGNEKQMTEIMEVLEPPETKIELSANYSTKYMRDPLDATVRARVELGHPDDRVEKFEWFLDDKLLEEQTKTRADVTGMTAGKHKVKVKVTSKFGLVKEATLDVNVAENLPPVCNIEYKQYGSTINARSGCEDPDGEMATHNWFVDGELVHVHANNVSVPGHSGDTIHFRVVGYDDSGAKAESTLVVKP